MTTHKGLIMAACIADKHSAECLRKGFLEIGLAHKATANAIRALAQEHAALEDQRESRHSNVAQPDTAAQQLGAEQSLVSNPADSHPTAAPVAGQDRAQFMDEDSETLAGALYAHSYFHDGEPNPTAELMRAGAQRIRSLLTHTSHAERLAEDWQQNTPKQFEDWWALQDTTGLSIGYKYAAWNGWCAALRSLSGKEGA